MIKKKIAVIHPTLSLGGAGAVAIWTIEALKRDYNLTLITTEDISVSELNAFFGTSLKPTEFQVGRVRTVFDSFLIKIALAQCYYKRYSKKFDLAIATRCEMDLGEPGIQYIHSPIWNEQMLRQLGQLPLGWQYREGLPRWVYRRFAMYLGKYSEERMKQNITLVNSNWMGERVKEAYRIETRTIYPPVKDDFSQVPWEEREDGFVCVGTVSLGKHVEDMILIINQVRQEGLLIHFHIIGGCSDPVYAKKIKQLCEENREWLFWEGRLPRKQLTHLVAKHKYGIHGMPNEHFGIVVAEMIKAGCIPFVPNGGGQVEIVQDRRLIYEDKEDAVYKIFNIINGEAIQKDIRKKLLKRSNQFSIKVFAESIRLIVEQALAQKR